MLREGGGGGGDRPPHLHRLPAPTPQAAPPAPEEVGQAGGALMGWSVPGLQAAHQTGEAHPTVDPRPANPHAARAPSTSQPASIPVTVTAEGAPWPQPSPRPPPAPAMCAPSRPPHAQETGHLEGLACGYGSRLTATPGEPELQSWPFDSQCAIASEEAGPLVLCGIPARWCLLAPLIHLGKCGQ